MEGNALALARVQLHDAAMDVDSEEEDEEEDEEDAVLLGFLRQPADRRLLQRHQFPSKAGGGPAWLDPIHIPHGDKSSCGICGKPLRFLLQVYAPADGVEDAFHRTVFVFICSRLFCLRQHSQQQREAREAPPGSVEVARPSIRAFRCQLARSNRFYDEVAPQVATPSPAGQVAVLCSWCATWRGDKRCGGCRLAAYCSEAHQKQHWRAGHAEICREAQAARGNSKAGATGGAPPGDQSAAPPSDVEELAGGKRASKEEAWPEFELVVEEEGEEEDLPEAAAMGGGGRPHPRLVGVTSDSFQDAEDEQGAEKVQWAAFEARIGREPEQCLRYCWSPQARPLWPRLDDRPPPGGIPPCPSCGSHRIFEFQILPQMLYYMKVDDTDPESLDWSTLAVYTCENSCANTNADADNAGYLDEYVWAQMAP